MRSTHRECFGGMAQSGPEQANHSPISLPPDRAWNNRTAPPPRPRPVLVGIDPPPAGTAVQSTVPGRSAGTAQPGPVPANRLTRFRRTRGRLRPVGTEGEPMRGTLFFGMATHGRESSESFLSSQLKAPRSQSQLRAQACQLRSRMSRRRAGTQTLATRPRSVTGMALLSQVRQSPDMRPRAQHRPSPLRARRVRRKRHFSNMPDRGGRRCWARKRGVRRATVAFLMAGPSAFRRH